MSYGPKIKCPHCGKPIWNQSKSCKNCSNIRRYKMQEYNVWIEQINQTRYHVKANNKEEAIKKAEKLWKKEIYPMVADVEKVD